MKIPDNTLPNIYKACRQVYETNTTPIDAANVLSEQFGLNSTSATIYFHVFQSLIRGQVFKRTLNAFSMEYLLVMENPVKLTTSIRLKVTT